jgi:predicted protein tyrosine phosphatase
MNLELLEVLPDIRITDWTTCGEVLEDGEAYDDEEDKTIKGPFSHVISIVGTWYDEGDPPGGWEVWSTYPAQKLRLEFDDVPNEPPEHHLSSDFKPPSLEQVQQILDFGGSLSKSDRLLIHCAAGISRSTGAGLAVVAKFLGPGNEELAVHALMDIKQSSRPHAGIVHMADAVLERGGQLSAAYLKIWGR